MKEFSILEMADIYQKLIMLQEKSSYHIPQMGESALRLHAKGENHKENRRYFPEISIDSFTKTASEVKNEQTSKLTIPPPTHPC